MLAPIRERVYRTADDLRSEDERTLVLAEVAQHLARFMRDVDPETHAKLAERASVLVDRALDLRSSFLAKSLELGLTKILSGVLDPRPRELVEHVLALPQNDPYRIKAIASLLQSRTVLGEELTKTLLDGTGLQLVERKVASVQPAHETGPAMG